MPEILTSVIPVRDLAISVLRDAWGFGPEDPFHPGRPFIPEVRLPHGVARLDNVPRAFDAGRSVAESISFVFAGYFPMREGVDLVAEQVDKAKSAGAALLGANWRGLSAYQPQVTNVDFLDADDPEPYFVVAIAFSVSSDVFQ